MRQKVVDVATLQHKPSFCFLENPTGQKSVKFSMRSKIVAYRMFSRHFFVELVVEIEFPVLCNLFAS